jgi:hypothetical protein
MSRVERRIQFGEARGGDEKIGRMSGIVEVLVVESRGVDS